MHGKGIPALVRQAGHAVLGVDRLFFQKFIGLYSRAALHEQHHRHGHQHKQGTQPQPGGEIGAEIPVLGQRTKGDQRDRTQDAQRCGQRHFGRVGMGLGQVVVRLGQCDFAQGGGIVPGGVLRLAELVF